MRRNRLTNLERHARRKRSERIRRIVVRVGALLDAGVLTEHAGRYSGKGARCESIAALLNTAAARRDERQR